MNTVYTHVMFDFVQPIFQPKIGKGGCFEHYTRYTLEIIIIIIIIKVNKDFIISE